MTKKLSRRHFIQNTTAAAAGLTLYLTVPGCGASQQAEPVQGGGEAPSFAPNARLSIGTDGKVTVHIEKAEMGQGITIALAQIVAEELEADWSNVTATLNTYTAAQGFVITASSWSVFTLFDSISRAAASARMMLVDVAAKEWGVKPSECTASMSMVTHGDQCLSYGEIVKMKPAAVTMSDDALKKIKLKDPADYKVIGTAHPSPHHAAKAQGKLAYGMDKSLPGMVYAKIAYPPSIGETHLTVDDIAANRQA